MIKQDLPLAWRSLPTTSLSQQISDLPLAQRSLPTT